MDHKCDKCGEVSFPCTAEACGMPEVVGLCSECLSKYSLDKPASTVQTSPTMPGLGEVVTSPWSLGDKYLVAQIRATEDAGNWLRIQGKHPSIPYYEASRPGFGTKLVKYVQTMKAPYPSLAASSGAKYAMCLLRPVGSTGVKLQIPGVSANREWGASVTVDWGEVRNYVKEMMVKALDKESKPAPKPAPKPKHPLFKPGNHVTLTKKFGKLEPGSLGIVTAISGGVLYTSWKGFDRGHDCDGKSLLPFGEKSGYYVWSDKARYLKRGWLTADKPVFNVGDRVQYFDKYAPSVHGLVGKVKSVSSEFVYIEFPGKVHNGGKGFVANPANLKHVTKGGDDCPF